MDNSIMYVNDRVLSIDATADTIKLYLRSMSSMTEKEAEEYNDLCFCNTPYSGIAEDAVAEFMDWLNSHHFDYRELIERGLALEAPEGMYKTE